MSVGIRTMLLETAMSKSARYVISSNIRNGTNSPIIVFQLIDQQQKA